MYAKYSDIYQMHWKAEPLLKILWNTAFKDFLTCSYYNTFSVGE